MILALISWPGYIVILSPSFKYDIFHEAPFLGSWPKSMGVHREKRWHARVWVGPQSGASLSKLAVFKLLAGKENHGRVVPVTVGGATLCWRVVSFWRETKAFCFER